MKQIEFNSSEEYLNFQLERILIYQSDTLDLSNIDQSKIPEEVFDLEGIKRIYLGRRGTSIRFDEDEMFWVRLNYLDENYVRKLPKELLKMKDDLETISLNGMDFSRFPEELYEFRNLMGLTIQDSGLENDLVDFSKFSKLQHLSLDMNNYKEIPQSITSLKHLKMLSISGNNIVSIHEDFSRLMELEHLDLSFNSQLDKASLTNIPSCLNSLHLIDTSLESFPVEELKHAKITQLDLSANEISELPDKLGDLESLKQLRLDGEKIQNIPPELLASDNEVRGIDIGVVKGYFEALKEGAPVELNELKVIMVGEGRVGKSTIVDSLTDENFKLNSKKSTEGINVVKWSIPKEYVDTSTDFNINVWDFGGQEIYYSTHQFFLTKRSLYILVTESRKEDSYDLLSYWFNIIKALGGNSPLIFVLNKVDQPTKELPVQQFKNKFDSMIDFKKVSCAEGYEGSVSRLRQSIIRAIKEKDHLNHIGILLPNSWVNIRKSIEVLQESGEKCITFERFVEICSEYGIKEQYASMIGGYLHDLGAFLFFKDDPYLQSTIFLDHNWVTKAVYRILDDQSTKLLKGRFSTKYLFSLWKNDDYGSRKKDLLRLMEKFEICFKLQHSLDEYIAPELLPVDAKKIDLKDYLKKDTGFLNYKFIYKFFPKGILSRLIVRLHNYIEGNNYWRHGVVLRYEHAYALVQEDIIDKAIGIQIKGPVDDKMILLGIINSSLKGINKEFENIEVFEMVPCSCSKCEGTDDPHFYDSEELKKYSYNDISKIRCSKSLKEVFVSELRTGVTRVNPVKEFTRHLIEDLGTLQDSSKNINSSEDARNSFIGKLLENRGYVVQDQTQQGKSASGKNVGEIDLKIKALKSRDEDYSRSFICEAFILSSLSKTVIDSHLNKLYGYDAPGNTVNFIIVYSEAAKFDNLWAKYLKYIDGKNIVYEFKDLTDLSENLNYTDIKLAKVEYKREGRNVTLYHLFANLKQS